MSVDRWVDNIPGGYSGDSDSEMEVEIEDGIFKTAETGAGSFSGYACGYEAGC